MRLAGLYLRSRRVGRAFLTLGISAVVAWALTWFLVSQTPYGVRHGGLTMMLVFGALAAACVIGVSAHSPFGDAERAVARPLSPLRFSQLAGSILWAALALCAALLTFDLEGARPEYPLYVLLRNLAFLSGIALVTARIAGARLSWIAPFVFALAYLTFMGSGSDVLAAWANRSYHGLHGPSWLAALAILAIGLGLVCYFGTRERVGEAG